jgi:hypothetical protein
MRGGQGQKLYQARRFPQTPGILAYGAPLHRYPEATQHPDTHGLGTPTNGAVLTPVHATNLAYARRRVLALFDPLDPNLTLTYMQCSATHGKV